MSDIEKITPMEENAKALNTEEANVEENSVVTADEEAKKEPARKYQNMSQGELVEIVAGILNEGNMNAHKEIASIKHAFFNIVTKDNDEALAKFVEEGNPVENFTATPSEHEVKMREMLQEFKEKRTAFLEELEARLITNLEKKKEVLKQMEEIADDIDNVNVKFPQFQQLQQDFKAIKEIPASAETEIWKKFQTIGELFYDRLKMNKELRDLDFKKNLEAKRELIEAAKALDEEKDVISAFRKLQDLHLKWREIGPVVKDLRDSIWDEFKEASTVINKKHQTFFETKKAAETANEEAKIKICEEIEAIDVAAIKNYSEWDEATKKIIALQEEWKKIGYASHKVNTALYTRYRAACDDFFTKKAEFYKNVKAEYASNLEKKTALCEKVEALKEAAPKDAIEQVQKLQAEWRKIGAVPKKYNDSIWQRFNSCCNYFFEERKKQAQATRKEEMANLEEKRAVVEALKAIPLDIDRNEGVAKVRELQAKWQQIGHVPFKMKDKLFGEYREVVDTLYDSFKMKETNRRMSNFEGQLKDIDDNRLEHEKDRLLRQLDQKRNELKTYQNNLGFFNVKSSAGNNMLKEMERKMKNIKEEIELIEKKIDLVDSKIN